MQILHLGKMLVFFIVLGINASVGMLSWAKLADMSHIIIGRYESYHIMTFQVKIAVSFYIPFGFSLTYIDVKQLGKEGSVLGQVSCTTILYYTTEITQS